MNATYQISESTMLVIRVVSSILQLVGILLAAFRLWFRVKIQRLWWEDAWSFVACVCAIVLLTSEWMYLQGDRLASVVGFWIYNLVLTCLIWCAAWSFCCWVAMTSASRAVRMSILFSVARIVHQTERIRLAVLALATLFSLIFLSFMAMKVWWFAHDSSWVRETAFYTKPACWLPHSMYIYELCADCISYTILVSLPLRLLWNMKLPQKQRRMILAIFSSSIIIMTVSIFRAVSQIKGLLSLVGLATDLEAACSIIVCNSLVVGTFTYRFLRRVSEDGDNAASVENTIKALTLTTVGFSAVGCSNDSSQLGTCGIPGHDSILSQ